ncbi:MAG: HAMP domain-containing histidine kinase [Candidatus Eisenbacteria bacterium]|uniref:histidine kinase n=1 Tax=Eiseniibacteriota bacterium TaxID=2212470 RepID=A0A956LXF9_UNCEI|nr:HAMP domain-containing histidine kinase [Candidatus Eisenbacteria bacterium]
MELLRATDRGDPPWWARLFPGYADNTRLLTYVISVVASGVVLLSATAILAGPAQLLSVSLLVWFLCNFGAEFLWLETESGEGTDSMALTMNFAVILLLPAPLALWVVALSVLLATRFIQKRDPLKALFGLGQMALTTAVAATLFHLVNREEIDIASFQDFRSICAMLLCAAAYFFVNTFLVTGAMTLQHRVAFWDTWRKNYGYRNNIVSSIALFSFAPMLVLAYLSIGYAGLLLFFLPLLIVKNQNREYLNMRRMMQERVDREKMAERGKLAAGIAHEMNNYLAIMTGRVQLLAARASKHGDDKMRSDADVIREQIEHMRVMAKGLMDFSHRGVRAEPTDVNRFLVRQMDMLRPYPVLKGVEMIPELSPEVGTVDLDQGQIGQVVVNLVKNAAEAIKEWEGATEAPMITLRSLTVKGNKVRIEVVDNGPGMPKAVQEKIFDAFYSTKKDGHGFGLATCKTILGNHRGKIWVESEVGKGTTFVLEIPRTNPDRSARTAENGEGAKSPTAKSASVTGTSTASARASAPAPAVRAEEAGNPPKSDAPPKPASPDGEAAA